MYIIILSYISFANNLFQNKSKMIILKMVYKNRLAYRHTAHFNNQTLWIFGFGILAPIKSHIPIF